MGLIEAPSRLAEPVRPRRLTVAEFHRLGEVGVIGPEERLELIEGDLVAMAPIGTRHASCVRTLSRRLHEAAGNRGLVAVQDPLDLGGSETLPDLMLLQPRGDAYADAHPTPPDVRLLIEVSDTTTRYDREVKLPLYAAAGVPEVWIVGLPARLLRRHRRPIGAEYAEVLALDTPAVLDVAGSFSIDCSGLFGAPAAA
jgi:Uma2 family endonuclease